MLITIVFLTGLRNIGFAFVLGLLFFFLFRLCKSGVVESFSVGNFIFPKKRSSYRKLTPEQRSASKETHKLLHRLVDRIVD